MRERECRSAEPGSASSALQMTARTPPVTNMLRMVLLLRVVSGIAFAVAHARIQDLTGTPGRIVARSRRRYGRGLLGRRYKVVIECQVHGQTKRFTTSPVIWDISLAPRYPCGTCMPAERSFGGWTTFTPFRRTRSEWRSSDGSRPFLCGLVLISVPGLRHEALSSQTRGSEKARNRSHRNLGAKRKLRLNRLHRLLLRLAAMLGFVALGVVRRSVWMLIIALSGVVPWRFAAKRVLACPVICRNCGRSLDD